MTLEEIKKHPHFPFKNFQKNKIEFLMLELYWAELFAQALGSEVAESWHSEFPADSEEGNPILHVANRGLNRPRVVRVIQRFNNHSLPELNLETLAPLSFESDAFVAYVPDITQGALDQDMTTPIDELLISSSVSDVCEKLFREHIRLWCVENVSQEVMSKKLESYWNRVNKSLIQKEH